MEHCEAGQDGLRADGEPRWDGTEDDGLKASGALVQDETRGGERVQDETRGWELQQEACCVELLKDDEQEEGEVKVLNRTWDEGEASDEASVEKWVAHATGEDDGQGVLDDEVDISQLDEVLYWHVPIEENEHV